MIFLILHMSALKFDPSCFSLKIYISMTNTQQHSQSGTVEFYLLFISVRYWTMTTEMKPRDLIQDAP